LNYFATFNFQGYSGNRNTLSFQLLVCIALALAYSGVQLRAKRMALWVALFGVLALGVWQAGSIAGLAATAVLSAVALWRWPERRGFVLSGIAVALVLSFVWWAIPNWLSPPAANLLSENGAVFDPIEVLGNSSSVERWSSIVGALSVWRDNPLFGGGLGAVVRLNLGLDGTPLVTHSTPVWVLAEFGLVGLIALASLPGWLLWRYRARIAVLAQPQHVAICLLLLFFAVFSAVHDVAFQRIWWLVLGALAASAKRPSARPTL
jgi:hypothetical protein